MAQKILYINPIKKSKRSLTKGQAMKKKKTARKTRRKAAPTAVVNVRSNPIKRRRRSVKRRKNPVFARRRAPQTAAQGIGQRLLVPAAVSAGGAVALDVVWSNLPIPVSLKTGAMQHIAKAGIALGLVKVAGNFMSKQNAERLGLGALTVLMHGVARDIVKKSMPTLKIGEFGEIGEVDMLGEYVGAGNALDFSAPLSFYATADGGENMIQSYALPSSPAPAPAPAPAVGEYVGEYIGEYDDDEVMYYD